MERGESQNDPFVCFRRRQTRTTRKTRRTDQMLYDKMVRLRSEMERVRTLLEMCRNRDKMKKELMAMDWNVFDQRLTLRDWKRRQLMHQRILQSDEVAGDTPITMDVLNKVDAFDRERSNNLTIYEE